MKTIKSGFRKVASGIKNAVRHIDNSVFCRLMKKPEVKSIDETIDYILKNNCSVSRFGDGELLMILGYRNGFQTYSRELAVRLEEVLKSNLSNHIVCLADMFGSLKKLNKESIKYNKKYLSKYRRKLYRIIPRKKEGGFYNTFFTRPYNMFRDKSDSARWFNNNKKIWQDKDLLIVEGEKTLLGVGNDLFKNAKSIERIICPSKNAFMNYEDILSFAKRFGKDKLILCALGMTATVLTYDLAKEGYWAIDIGHIDVEYEWYLRGSIEKISIPGKFVNEAKETYLEDASIKDEKYLKSIIVKI